jgi:hypothetical protein
MMNLDVATANFTMAGAKPEVVLIFVPDAILMLFKMQNKFKTNAANDNPVTDNVHFQPSCGQTAEVVLLVNHVNFQLLVDVEQHRLR